MTVRKRSLPLSLRSIAGVGKANMHVIGQHTTMCVEDQFEHVTARAPAAKANQGRSYDAIWIGAERCVAHS